MKRGKYMAILVALGLGLALTGATPGDTNPSISTGAITLLANTATPCPPLAALGPRNALALCNLGANDVWVGDSSSVTDLTGFPIYKNGGCLPIDVTYDAYRSKPTLYCYTTVAQAPSTNLRWMVAK